MKKAGMVFGCLAKDFSFSYGADALMVHRRCLSFQTPVNKVSHQYSFSLVLIYYMLNFVDLLPYSKIREGFMPLQRLVSTLY